MALKSWKSIIHPRQEVLSGKINEGSFAANLSLAVAGTGPSVYTDAKEFFERTYITEGLFSLLVKALKRLAGKGEDAVVQIQTNFGGGKTHAMIALYHLLHWGNAAELAGCDKILQAAGVDKVPHTNVSVIVGIEHGSLGYYDEWLGCQVNTFWGEIAANLAREAGDKSIYDVMRKSDETFEHPGAKRLRELFERAGGTVCIIMDELVKYAASLPVDENKEASTKYASFMAFIQELTEAANATRRVLVVASLPSSDIEADGPNGKEALRTLSHLFGRVDTVWRAASAQEGFEIVRRRLFDECIDTAARDEVCTSFCRMYKEHSSDFPQDARKEAYLERMIRCYPIHPEVFDVLYGTWSTLERFQRTRGVLRFVASVIKVLWGEEKSESIIMCGSLPLYDSNVQDSLVRVLENSKTWKSVIDKEIDGKDCVPHRCDAGDLHFGECHPCARAARAVMLGSAPSSADSSQSMLRGVDAAHLMLGTVMAGESISIFYDALRALTKSLTYLYSKDMERFWFDVHPTLRKTAAERAERYYNSDDKTEIYDEIKRRLRLQDHTNGDLLVCVCPSSPSVVADEKKARLVILPPSLSYSRTAGDNSSAVKTARNILDTIGENRSRTYRNTLLFLTCINEDDTYTRLLRSTAEYLAWQSIQKDVEADTITIDSTQARDMQKDAAASDKETDAALGAAYYALLAPSSSRTDGSNITWREYDSAHDAQEGIARRAADTARQMGAVAGKSYNEAAFADEVEHGLIGEEGYISVKRLEEIYFQYCYIQRLSAPPVLYDAIKQAARKEYVALASSYSEGKFDGLVIGEAAAGMGAFNADTLVVKRALAQKQLDEEKTQQAERAKEQSTADANNGGGGGNASGASEEGAQNAGGYGGESGEEKYPPPPKRGTHNHFFVDRTMNNDRLMEEYPKLVQDVVGVLRKVEGVSLDVRVTIDAYTKDKGECFPLDTEETLHKACKTLRLKEEYGEYGFEG